MELTPDEFLLDRIFSKNIPTEDFIKTITFINCLMEICTHKLAIRRNSPFMDKFKNNLNNRQTLEQPLKVLKDLMYNSDKVKFYEEYEINTNFDGNVIPDDDKYLVETAMSTLDKIIITTDEDHKPLFEKVDKIRVYLLKDFLQKNC